MKSSFTTLPKIFFMWNSNLSLPSWIQILKSRSVWTTIMQSAKVQTLINGLEICDFMQIKIFQKNIWSNFWSNFSFWPERNKLSNDCFLVFMGCQDNCRLSDSDMCYKQVCTDELWLDCRTGSEICPKIRYSWSSLDTVSVG